MLKLLGAEDGEGTRRIILKKPVVVSIKAKRASLASLNKTKKLRPSSDWRKLGRPSVKRRSYQQPDHSTPKDAEGTLDTPTNATHAYTLTGPNRVLENLEWDDGVRLAGLSVDSSSTNSSFSAGRQRH